MQDGYYARTASRDCKGVFVEDVTEEIPAKAKAKRNPSAPDYGPWVPDFLIKTLKAISIAALVVTAATAFVFGNVPIGIALAVVTLVALCVTFYLMQVKKLFRPGRNSIMTKLHHHLLERLSWDGEGVLLDTGAGNGELAIRCAFTYSNARVFASDRWNRGFAEWGYSLWQCRENARIEDVAERVEFVPASADGLDFEDGTFDAVVSCFVRMDTGYEEKKREQLFEAFRVLKEGGRFSLMGMFAHRELYGDMNVLIAELQKLGVSELHYEPDVASLDFVPGFARLPLMVRRAGLLYGVK